MKRYLLFDGSCPKCCRIADAIQEAAGEKLETLSLHDPQAKELLFRAYPNGWSHQPYLLTVDGDKARGITDMALALRLGLLLGPRKAWQIWGLSRQLGVTFPFGDSRFSPERRGFLRQVPLFLAGLLLFPRQLLQSITGRSAMLGEQPPPPEGELYHGFVLLPEGAPIPSTVKPSRLGIPSMCGAGEGGATPTAVTKSLNTFADLLRESRLPLYSLRQVPENLRASGGHVIRHRSGELFVVSVNYQSYNPENGIWEGSVRLGALPDFPRPFPLWSSSPDLPPIFHPAGKLPAISRYIGT